MSRHAELRRQCQEFHSAHPEAWDLFQRFALEKAALGFEHYSANGVFERIRWETSVGGQEPELKLNNNYRPFYARRFNRLYPHLGEGEFFRVREQTSTTQPATGRADYRGDRR